MAINLMTDQLLHRLRNPSFTMPNLNDNSSSFRFFADLTINSSQNSSKMGNMAHKNLNLF